MLKNLRKLQKSYLRINVLMSISFLFVILYYQEMTKEETKDTGYWTGITRTDKTDLNLNK